MIVIDASSALEVLLRTRLAEAVAARIEGAPGPLHAPHLIDVEIAQVLRRYEARRAITPARAREAAQDWLDLRVTRHAHAVLLPRVWELRHALSAYDATYVALAEALDAPLLTCDGSLARAPGHRARIVLVA